MTGSEGFKSCWSQSFESMSPEHSEQFSYAGSNGLAIGPKPHVGCFGRLVRSCYARELGDVAGKRPLVQTFRVTRDDSLERRVHKYLYKRYSLGTGGLANFPPCVAIRRYRCDEHCDSMTRQKTRDVPGSCDV